MTERLREAGSRYPAAAGVIGDAGERWKRPVLPVIKETKRGRNEQKQYRDNNPCAFCGRDRHVKIMSVSSD